VEREEAINSYLRTRRVEGGAERGAMENEVEDGGPGSFSLR
jgi:hypothetical protein